MTPGWLALAAANCSAALPAQESLFVQLICSDRGADPPSTRRRRVPCHRLWTATLPGLRVVSFPEDSDPCRSTGALAEMEVPGLLQCPGVLGYSVCEIAKTTAVGDEASLRALSRCSSSAGHPLAQFDFGWRLVVLPNIAT
jgi:hypothetical protein